MLQAELFKQLLRVRSMVALGILAAVPVIAGLVTLSHAGERNGTEVGLYGAGPYSALNHTAASLQFTAPLLLALVVALLGSAFGAADRDWGTLRYLYVQPVSRMKLMTGKWMALIACCLLATATVVVSGLIIGLIAFGWHPFHLLGAHGLSAGSAAGRLAEATLYVAACTLSIGTLAFALGLVLPGPAEALGLSVAVVVISNILDGQPSLRSLDSVLAVHYWGRWTHLLEGGSSDLALGVAVQAVWILTVLAGAWLLLMRRDPAA
jgi:ABC-type transport system involved in multi-copper enzyme maturation permease subunit